MLLTLNPHTTGAARYMQDKGFLTGDSFIRVDDGTYRHGDGGRFVGHEPVKRGLDRKHWQRSAAETVRSLL